MVAHEITSSTLNSACTPPIAIHMSFSTAAAQSSAALLLEVLNGGQDPLGEGRRSERQDARSGQVVVDDLSGHDLGVHDIGGHEIAVPRSAWSSGMRVRMPNPAASYFIRRTVDRARPISLATAR